MKNKVLKTAVAILLIIAITMVDFIQLGKSLITYAFENGDDSTNHENVKFTAYFKAGSETVSEAECEINNKEMELYMAVSVKNEGYFDGVITLEDSNFKLKQDKLSEGISKIEGNTITLNRVTAGKTVEIEVGIEPIVEEVYGENMLSKESTLKLTGDYKDSTEKIINIQSEKKVNLTLLAPSDLETVLDGNVITNKIYKIEEQNKRIVQIELNSTVLENAYPINKTIFELSLPEGIEKIEVISNGTYATNGEADKNLEEKSYKYDEENKRLIVTLENTSKDGKISWKKDAKDSIVVTLILAENAVIGEEEYSVKSKVEFKGEEGKLLEKEIKYNLTEETVGIIRTLIENKEEIYKGKIYSKEEREYKTITNIEVNYANLIEGSNIEEKTIYRTDSEDKHANIEYKTTKISKLEIEKILGAEGTLTIKDGQGNILAEITRQIRELDDNENIEIQYEAGIKEIQIQISKTVNTGIIRLNHTKIIKAEEYTKEEITELKYLVEQTNTKSNIEDGTTVQYGFESQSKLGETKTLAELTVVPQTLSTAAVNEQVKFAVTLRTDNEQYDLYKNPIIKIKLPDYVKNIEVIKATPLYLENLVISRFEYFRETKEIQLQMQGEQTKYNGINTNVYIEILANIELEETVASKQDTIALTYANEKAVAYQNEGKSIVPINISGYSGLVAFNYITNYNLKTNSVTSKEEQMGSLKMYEKATEANFQIALVNNTGSDLEDVKVLGNLPVEGNMTLGNYTFENTIRATLKTGIIVESENATVYYTANGNATKDINNIENGWNSNLTDVTNPVLYMIVISNMAKETSFMANYTMNIPENLQYDKDMRTTYLVEYSDNISQTTVDAIPLGLETGKVSVILAATVGEEELTNGMSVKAGEVIKYKVTVTNTGSHEAKDIVISGRVPEGTVHVQPIMGEGYDRYDYYVDKYYEETENAIVEQVIEALAAGENKEFEYEVRVKSDITQGIAENQVAVTYNDNIEIKSNKLTNNLESGNIRVTVKRTTDIYDIFFAEGQMMTYSILVENISNKEQKDIDVNISLPGGIDYYDIESVQTKSIHIDSILSQHNKVYELHVKTNGIEENKREIGISAIATCDEEEYRSNAYKDTIYGYDVQMQVSTTRKEEYLKPGETIEYTIKVINNSEIVSLRHKIETQIPQQLTVQKIEKNNEEQEIVTNNYISYILEIEPHTEVEIKITAVVNYSEIRNEVEQISTIVKLMKQEKEISVEGPIIHYLEANPKEGIEVPEGPTVEPEKPETPINPETPDDTEKPEQPDGPTIEPENPEDPNEPENPENPNEPEKPETPEEPEKPEAPEEPGEIVKKQYSISGKAWIDQNKDGEFNQNDTLLKDTKVKLLNVETNQFVRNSEKTKDLIVSTNQEGFYNFENIEEGKYIVVFEYDKTLYKPTTYEKEGIDETKNSNVVSKTIMVNGEQKEYAITNEIELKQNLTNINMGLVFIKQFDIKLDKYISKVIVQTSEGTKTYDYENKDFAKVEINAKRIVGATILVQYTIKVTNLGDVDAYINSIVDYAPAGLKYSSELNKDWYEKENKLHINVFQGTPIVPGESKEVNLILTKTKTDGNAELINNMAEIEDAYNIYGIADTNSTQANKNKDENDFDSADFMISIQTGTVFNYIGVVISMIAIVGVAIYIINKKVLEENI